MSTEKSNNAKLILHRAKLFLGISKDKDLVKRLGVAQSTLSTWKSRDSVDLEAIIAICEGINVNWLLTGAGEMRSVDEKAPAGQVIEPVSKINIAGMQHGEVLVRYVPTKDEATGEPFYARITIERLTPDEAKRELGK